MKVKRENVVRESGAAGREASAGREAAAGEGGAAKVAQKQRWRRKK